MADNYLEKRMEEYRAGRLAPKNQRHAASPVRKAGELTLSYPPMTALVLADDPQWTETLCAAFRKADFKVSFCMADMRTGNRIAQSTGSRFYPLDPDDSVRLAGAVEDIVERWGAIDVVLDLRGLDIDREQVEGEEAMARIASLLLLHSHPDFGFVVSTELSV